jgi:hypothetical protein
MKYLVYDTIFIEEHDRPTVTLAYKYFTNDAMSAASSRGLPGIRVVPESIVSECSVMEEIEAGVSAVMEDIIAGLTKPLTDEEKSPKPMATEKSVRAIFKGSLDEVNRFFYQRGWTDGLPIIPPTEAAVTEMLKGTDLPPDHLVAKLEPRLGKATVEKIAVNAVMAGALPSYMPLLIAGVKLLSKSPMADVWAVSTGSWMPVWIVNGPIRKDLNINDGFGVLSPGEIANTAIGRAMGLITKNIRGVRKEIEDMGVLGNPGKYSMVIAENEEDSPWEPLHVENGLKKEDSAISVCFPNSYQQQHSYATDDKGLLNTVIYNVTAGRMGMLTIMMTPVNAKALADRGWTKKDIKAHIMENTTAPRDHFAFYRPDGDEKEDPKELVPLFNVRPGQPAPIQIFVAGGWGSWTGLITGGQGITMEKIELPPNWDKLVAKYKNVVPTYARY